MFQPNPLPAERIAILVQANRLLVEGQPMETGSLFTQVAEAVKISRHPRRAANLYARAAHAFVDAAKEQAALDNARAALALLTQTRMAGRTAAFFTNITHKMNAQGMKAAVDALQREYGGEVVASPPVSLPKSHGLLPTNCPKCGAPIHVDELNWVDENTIECEYCGAFVRSE